MNSKQRRKLRRSIPPLVAFQINGYEESEIVFARDREDAIELSEIYSYSIERRPEFDIYYPGPIPTEILFKNGWWFECWHCGSTVNSEMDECCNFDQEGNDLIEDDIGPYFVEKKKVFCNIFCCKADEASELIKSRMKYAAIELIHSKYPEVTSVDYVYVNGDSKRTQSYFRLPGMQDSVRWNFDEDACWVSARDKETFLKKYVKENYHE